MIELQQFLKIVLNVTGGEAKHIIQDGLVCVNGVVETRRSRKLALDDVVGVNLEEVAGEKFKVSDFIKGQ
ncbi:MAG: RNA-binding S4 domain-containing protein [Coprothermobacter sp.]|nr:RNA-binding S4 domain-containing protein [Coprothermobacter sp.]